MPVGTPPVYPQPGNQRPVQSGLGSGSALFTIGSNAFLNAGIISQGGTITGKSLVAHALLIGAGTATVGALAPGATGNLAVSDGTDWTATNLIQPPPLIGAGAIGLGRFQPMGQISGQTAVSGNGNGADITDDTLFSYALPANSFDQIERGIIVEAYGLFGANGNDKTVKVFVNAVTWYTSGVVTLNAAGWYVRCLITLSAANEVTGTSIGFAASAVLGGVGVGSATGIPSASPISIVLTGASPTSGAANDVTAYGMSIAYLN